MFSQISAAQSDARRLGRALAGIPDYNARAVAALRSTRDALSNSGLPEAVASVRAAFNSLHLLVEDLR